MKYETYYYDKHYEFVRQALVFGSFVFVTRDNTQQYNIFDVSVGDETHRLAISDDLWQRWGFARVDV